MQNESAAPAGALTVRGLKAGYGRIEVLHGIDLDLPRGQLVALVGATWAFPSSTTPAA
jgi:branched-chain amino acid transport system ATP-binding protein